MKVKSYPIVDDFSDLNRLSAFGTMRHLTTYRVMSVSNAKYKFGNDNYFGFKLEGEVSLEYSGGFIQIVLSISPNTKPFDAVKYTFYVFGQRATENNTI